MSYRDVGGKFYAAMYGGLIVLIVLGVWFAASMEAKSYRKFCDAEVTTWDAVWLDLRIDEC